MELTIYTKLEDLPKNHPCITIEGNRWRYSTSVPHSHHMDPYRPNGKDSHPDFDWSTYLYAMPSSGIAFYDVRLADYQQWLIREDFDRFCREFPGHDIALDRMVRETTRTKPPKHRTQKFRIPVVKAKYKNVAFNPNTGFFEESLEIVRGDGSSRVTTNPNPHGAMHGGTLYVKVSGKKQNAAHYAWWVHHGERLPKGARICHLDGNIWNNKKDNLVIAVTKHHHAITRIAGAVVSLGRYASKDEAAEAVAIARALVGAKPVRTRNP